ncbi:MAG: translation elongation factor Ts [Vicinamibacteria bacterium]
MSLELVRDLREKTGAGLLDCQKALGEAQGDGEKALRLLRERGLAKAAKKSTRTATDGLVGSYIHPGGKIGVLVEVNCETDFVANTEEFRELVKNLGMHVAAANPRWVRREDVPADALEKERDILKSQAEGTGKPQNVLDKIVEGKLGKFYSQHVLLEQPYVKNEGQTIEEYLKSAIAVLKENIQVRRFVRFERGEALE